MSFLVDIDLREIGYVAGLIFFVISEVLSIHAVNLLRVDYATKVFYSESIKDIIYSQFAIIFMFYIYSHFYLAVRNGEYLRIFFFAVFAIVGLFCLVFGFFVTTGSTTLKIIGGFSVAMLFVLAAVEVIKVLAEKIFSFVSPIMICAVWIFIVLPYAELIPFISIFVDQDTFGIFIYACILGSIVLLILLVGILTLVFNRLIDKY